MQFSFSFIHMPTSEALQDYAESKITEKILKFATKPVTAKVTFSVDRHDQLAHCAVVGGDGLSIQVEHSCGDMYGSIDHMVDKLESQLKKQKEKLKNHKKKVDKIQVAEGAAAAAAKLAEDSGVDAEEVLKYEKARQRAHH